MRPRPRRPLLRCRAASATTRTRGAGSRSAPSRRTRRARAPGWPAAPRARPAPPRAPRACRRGSGRRPRAGLAQLELALALVELLELARGALSSSSESRSSRLSVRFLCDSEIVSKFSRLGLAGGELALALLEPDVPLLEVAAAVGVALGVRDRGLEPVQLRLASGQVELAPVELGEAGDRLLGDLALVGELALEPLGVVAQLLLPASGSPPRARRSPRRGRRYAPPPSSGRPRAARACARAPMSSLSRARHSFSRFVERPLAPVEPGRRGLLAGRDLALLARQLLLAVAERGRVLGQLGRRLVALAVGALQVAQPRSRRPPAARPRAPAPRPARPGGRPRACARPRSPRAGRGHAARAPRARPRTRPASPRARRGWRRAVGELLLRADVLVVGRASAPAAGRGAWPRGPAPPRARPSAPAPPGRATRLERVARRPARGQLEAQLDVGRPCGLLPATRPHPPACAAAVRAGRSRTPFRSRLPGCRAVSDIVASDPVRRASRG